MSLGDIYNSMKDELDETDPDSLIKKYFEINGKDYDCRVCGKRGIKYHICSPNDNISIEYGGWCSTECWEKEL